MPHFQRVPDSVKTKPEPERRQEPVLILLIYGENELSEPTGAL